MQNRDGNGAALGHGIEAGLLVTTATGSTGTITNMAYDYTNQDGVQRTNVNVGTFVPTTLTQGSFIPFSLYPGDTGVRSIDGIRLGTSLVSGAVSAVLFRRVCSAPKNRTNDSVQYDWMQLGLPKLYDNTALIPAFYPPGASNFVVLHIEIDIGEG
jgi:hypothetical protein